MKTIFLLTLALSSSVSAQELCKVESDRKVQVTPMPRVPNYFFRTSPDGRYIYYISEGRNWVLDTVTKKESVLPGSADPVPSADGRILTTIADQNRTNGNWTISVSVMENGLPAKNPQTVSLVPGSYQSVGNQRSDGSRPYLFYNEARQAVEIDTLKRGADGSYALVPGSLLSGDELRLPIMSPDGKRFSALNVGLNKTQIFDITGSPPQAVLAKTLPFAAGKSSFSPDSSQIVYHLSRGESSGYDNNETFYPATLSGMSMVRNVFTYDLKTGVVRQVTNNIQGNSYFPTFLNDGRVAYVNSPKDGEYQVIYSTVPEGKQRSLERVAKCYGGVDPMSDLTRLAREWEAACNRESMVDERGQGAMMVLNMSDANCKVLAQRAKDKDLMRLCKAMSQASAPAPTAGPSRPDPLSNLSSALRGKVIVESKCLICHGTLESLTAVYDKIQARVFSTDPKVRMPMGGAALSASDAKAVLEYIDGVRKGVVPGSRESLMLGE